MSRELALGAFVLGVLVIVAWRLHVASRETPDIFEPKSRVVEAAPVCPWREPDADMRRFFPEANRYSTEKRILSGVRVELAKQLGRQPDAEENTLTLHRVHRGSRALGAVLTRRVKGEHGAIELVLAVAEQGEVRGVHLQRLREPADIAGALQNPAWLEGFQGRTHARGWETDDALDLPPEARLSAQAIREGIRSLLILLAVSEDPSVPSTGKPHH
jgi:hypothetical protein